MKTVPGGQLRHLIDIQMDAGGSENAYGEAAAGWTSRGRTWASIQSAGGVESLRAAQVEGQISHRIVCRYVVGVTPADRIVHGERIFEIVQVSDRMERGRYLDILAKEVVGGGES